MSVNNGAYKEYIMAKKSQYKAVILDVLPKRFISTNQVIKEIKKKAGKSVHHYLVGRLLNELEKEGKIEKQEVQLGKQKLFLWRKRL
jgi:hypothetical protein